MKPLFNRSVLLGQIPGAGPYLFACLVGALILLSSVACYTVTSSQSVGTTLTRGSSIIYQDRFTVTFEGVSNDSRCPADVECPEAGEAYVQFSFTLEDQEPTDATMVIGPGGETWSRYAGYIVTLTALEPDPPPQREAGEFIEYVAHIEIGESDE